MSENELSFEFDGSECTQAVIEFLSVIDRDEVYGIDITLHRFSDDSPATDGGVMDTPSPEGEYADAPPTNDERRDRPPEDEGGDGPDGGSGNGDQSGTSDTAADTDESPDEDTVVTEGKETQGAVDTGRSFDRRTLGRRPEIQSGQFIPQGDGAASGTRYLRPGLADHEALYYLALYQYENDADYATGREVYDEYDPIEKLQAFRQALLRNFRLFDVLDVRDEPKKGQSTEYSVNDRGIRYLREHGYPVEQPYTIPPEYRREIQDVAAEE